MREYEVEILESYESVRRITLKAGNEKLLTERLEDMIEARRRRIGMDEADVVVLELTLIERGGDKYLIKEGLLRQPCFIS